MTLPFETTLRWATEADFDALADLMFAAVGKGESPYKEAQRQAWVPEPRRGSRVASSPPFAGDHRRGEHDRSRLPRGLVVRLAAT